MIKNVALKPESIAKGLVFTCLLIALYYTSHTVMIEWWEREDYNYCYLIPFVILYLLWEKLSNLQKIQSRPTWLGFLPLAIGICLFWLGELSGEYYSIYLSSWLVLIGLCMAHMGWRKFKVIWFPLAFIFTMFPPPVFIYNNISLTIIPKN